MSKVQTIFFVGSTGVTGSTIIDVLLKNDKFHVIAAVRPASTSKPAVANLKSRGAEVRAVDLESSSPEELQEHLKGVDMVVCTQSYNQLEVQRPLIYAAKAAGVKRFIPNDWAPPCVRGVRNYHDQKQVYRDLIRELGLGYTFIDVAWYQGLFPILDDATRIPGFAQIVTRTVYGDGETKAACIDLRDVGKIVERIIADERTLNKYVFAYAEELSQNEIIATTERFLGKDRIPSLKHESIESLTEKKNAAEGVLQVVYQYMHSLFARGDNTIAKAKTEEYGSALSVKELCPDYSFIPSVEFAKEKYSK